MPGRLSLLCTCLWMCLWGLSGCVTGGEASRSSSCDQLDVALSDEELRLHRLLNQYRKSYGLAVVRTSKSLTRVAQLHARDLEENPPRRPCNPHSWSSNGPWSACCYTPDHAQASCLWNKPRQLTPYKGDGYEIVAWYRHTRNDDIPARLALRALRDSPDHNAVMLNQGQWQQYQWRSVGVGIYGDYASVWYGVERDACGTAGD